MPLFLHEFIDNANPNYKNIDNGWWEYDPETEKLYNYSGGYHYHKPHPKEEIIESTWEEILAQHIRDDTLKTGWLSPDGEWFGCDTQHHDLFARVYLHSDESTLENQGWAKVTEVPAFLRYNDPNLWKYPHQCYYTRDFLTEAQKITLVEHNIFVEELF